MRTFLISAATAAAALTMLAAPASAQYRGQDRGGWDQRDHRDHRGYGDDRGYGRGDRQAVNQLLRDLDRVEQRIQRATQRGGSLSQREAFSLRREAQNIRERLYRAQRNGLSGREYQELRQRIDRLEQRVRYERHDRDGRRW